MHSQTKCAPDMIMNEKEYIARQVELLDGGHANEASRNSHQSLPLNYRKQSKPRPETNLSWLV